MDNYKVNAVVEALKELFPDEKKQMFNTRNLVGDFMVTVYDNNDVVIDYCPNWNYIEIFGLTKEEFQYIERNYGI